MAGFKVLICTRFATEFLGVPTGLRTAAAFSLAARAKEADIDFSSLNGPASSASLPPLAPAQP